MVAAAAPRARVRARFPRSCDGDIKANSQEQNPSSRVKAVSVSVSDVGESDVINIPSHLPSFSRGSVRDRSIQGVMTQ